MATSFAPDRLPPGPTSWIPGAHFLAFRRDPLTFFTTTARTYGDVARFTFGSQVVYLVSHPDMIEDVLVLSGRLHRTEPDLNARPVTRHPSPITRG